MTIFFTALAALIHVYIFALESLLWDREKTRKVFGMSAEKAASNKSFAFNQGFYNLFLALGAVIGLVLFNGEFQTAGQTLMVFTTSSMVGASLVLWYSEPRLYRPALIQGLPPFLAIACFFLL